MVSVMLISVLNIKLTCEWHKFYETLQDQIDKINIKDYIIVAGDYNAGVGKIPIFGILGRNGESPINNNGQKIK